MTRQSHKVVALISGGKDSFFSLLHCMRNGHEVVALANLHPQINDHSKDSTGVVSDHEQDINSFMYQTVGHNIIHLYAECLELPLYRQPIRGTAIDARKSYSAPTAFLAEGNVGCKDETESLIPLLGAVKKNHPEVTAVSTGAILSHYQRTRVESVAHRLNLVCLSYLWQYPYLPPHRPISLLEDMAAAGMEARIIKVASGGLDETDLWTNVTDLTAMRRIEVKMQKFKTVTAEAGNDDGAVLGEGGEFETLVLDGPQPVWKRRIAIEAPKDGVPWKVVKGEGGTASAQILSARTMEKEVILQNAMPSKDQLGLTAPILWDQEFELVSRVLRKATSQGEEAMGSDLLFAPVSPKAGVEKLKSTVKTGEKRLFMTNLTDHASSEPERLIDGVRDQLNHILQKIREQLTSHSPPLAPMDIAHVTILLRDISHFGAIDDLYASFFPQPNPPSRVTISLGQCLPSHEDVALSAVAIQGTHDARKGLHVQSQSYWAPANIGAYSQAISTPLMSQDAEHDNDMFRKHPEIVTLAGQIPLIPSTMTLPTFTDMPFPQQSALALQHLFRVSRAMDVSWFLGGFGFFVAGDSPSAYRRAHAIRNVWREIHMNAFGEMQREEGEDDEGEDIDIAELALRKSWAYRSASAPSSGKINRKALPKWRMLSTDIGQAGTESGGAEVEALCPPVIAAQVTALPRHAPVEWTSLGLSIPTSGDGHDRPLVVSSCSGATCSSTDADAGFPVHRIKILGSGVKYTFYRLRRHADYASLQDRLEEEREDGWNIVQSDIFFAAGRVSSKTVEELFVDQCKGMVVPCHNVWAFIGAGEDEQGGTVLAALRCRYERVVKGAEM